jgi:hypothetical protein
MTDFRFITDEQLGITVERDKKELDACLSQQLSKSAMLLAGSLIEAILVDYFLAFPRAGQTAATTLNAHLAQLIEWAEQDGLISPRTKEISTVVKNYRNLIHPGREYRLQERVDIHTATVAASLVEIIAEEIGENYGKRLGYTAEQAVKKVRLDPTSSAIFSHIVDKMMPIERVKLFRAIPDACKLGDDPPSVISSLVELHNRLKDRVSEEVVRAEASKVYDHLRNSRQEEAMFYLRFFTGNLRLLETDQQKAVFDYVFSILSNDAGEHLRLYSKWNCFGWLGDYLDNDEGIQRLYWCIVQRWDARLVAAADEFLPAVARVCSELSWERGQKLVARLRDLEEEVTMLEWADYIEGELIPF